jgi:hypothetical protein
MCTRLSFPGVKRLVLEADHSPPDSAKVMKMCIYTSTPPYAFMEWFLIRWLQGQLYLYFIVPCWRYLLGYRLGHSVFHTLYCRLHRRYYNRSVTNGSLTSCVDRSYFPSTPLTVDYFRWRRLFTVDSRQLPLGFCWLTLQTNCSATTTLSRVLLLSPTADYSLRRLAHRLSDFPGWLSRLTACDDDYD